MDETYVFMDFRDTQLWLGKRPGDKVIDPFYLRKSFGDNPYFWDEHKKKWVLVRQGAVFKIDEHGIPVLDFNPSGATGKKKAS